MKVKLDITIDNVFFYIICLMVLLIPPAFSNSPYFSTTAAKVILLRIGTILASILWLISFIKGYKGLKWHLVASIALVWVGLIALSVITAIHLPTAIFGSYERLDGLITAINLVAIFLLALQLEIGRAHV